MKYLLTERALQNLETFCREPGLLVALDFDGTLADLTLDREAARLLPKTRDLLKALQPKVRVAILSGRARSDVLKRVRLKGVEYIGNHGAEWKSGNSSSVPKIVRGWKNQILQGWEEPFPGFFSEQLEDKRYSLSLHYRKARYPGRAHLKLMALATMLLPKPVVQPGKKLINLVPRGAPHKGEAVLRLLKSQKLKRALYLGDDQTDEDVFALNQDLVFSIRVGKSSNSLAHYYVKDRTQVDGLLRILASFSKKSL